MLKCCAKTGQWPLQEQGRLCLLANVCSIIHATSLGHLPNYDLSTLQKLIKLSYFSDKIKICFWTNDLILRCTLEQSEIKFNANAFKILDSFKLRKIKTGLDGV